MMTERERWAWLKTQNVTDMFPCLRYADSEVKNRLQKDYYNLNKSKTEGVPRTLKIWKETK